MDENTLIPRHETEEVVEAAIEVNKEGYNVALHTNSKPDIAKDFADTLCKSYGVKAMYVQADISAGNWDKITQLCLDARKAAKGE